ncbi:unnamed protein product [Musa acuminata subsp. burmannicoides]
MQDPKYAYPYPAHGYYHGPPVMAPPQYAAAPPRRSSGFLEGCLAALCCCFLIDEFNASSLMCENDCAHPGCANEASQSRNKQKADGTIWSLSLQYDPL